MTSERRDPAMAAEREQRRGNSVELVAVFGLTVGLPLTLTILTGRVGSYDFGQRRILNTLAAETFIVVLLWPWLASRGWSFRQIAGAPEPFDVLRGLGLTAMAYAAYYFSALTWAAFGPRSYDALSSVVPSGTASLAIVAALCVVNPLVEEFLWLAYGVNAFERFGMSYAVIASVALRTTVHAYQGVVALIAIVPLGIVFTVYYARSRRLWPVIVAHVLFDAIALASVTRW
jgi:uncharacterized protein